jgi:nucleotide-binding universal stress UspA family protein
MTKTMSSGRFANCGLVIVLAAAAVAELQWKYADAASEGIGVADGGRRVIAGVSGSLRSLGALRAGVAEARSTGATLVAVLAWVPAGGEYAYRRAPCPVLLRVWEHAAQQRLDEAFEEAFGGLPADVTVHRVVARGKPGPILVKLADQPADLIVIGAGGHGLAGLARPGGVGRYCLAHARCPVLAVPPPDLINQVRSRSRRWRPEDFAVDVGSRVQGSRPDPGSGARAVAVTRQAPARGPSDEELPSAYRGAPYYQPRRPPWRRRVLRRLRLLTLLGAAVGVIVLTGLLLANGTY